MKRNSILTSRETKMKHRDFQCFANKSKSIKRSKYKNSLVFHFNILVIRLIRMQDLAEYFMILKVFEKQFWRSESVMAKERAKRNEKKNIHHLKSLKNVWKWCKFYSLEYFSQAIMIFVFVSTSEKIFNYLNGQVLVDHKSNFCLVFIRYNFFLKSRMIKKSKEQIFDFNHSEGILF